MTVDEVAEFLSVRPSTLYDCPHNGKMPASKVGRLWPFQHEQIQESVRNRGMENYLRNRPSSTSK